MRAPSPKWERSIRCGAGRAVGNGLSGTSLVGSGAASLVSGARELGCSGARCEMGSTIAKSTAIFLLIAAVPVVFAMPVATCSPVGGELPGINCLPGFALAVLGPSLFAFFLGMMVGGGRRSGGRRPAIRAMAALACGGLVVLGLPHDVALQDPWVFYDSLPATVLGPLIAFAIGWPLGSWLGRVIRAGDAG